jgi:hypothetical protein
MDIKQELLKQADASAQFPDIGAGLVKLCRDALAEIERLEKQLEIARAWLGFISKGENFSTVVSEEITMASAESLRYMAASTLKRLGG